MTMPGDERALKQARCPHCGGIVDADPVLCPFCRRPLRTGFENQRKQPRVFYLAETVSTTLRRINSMKERILEAFIAETGLLPSECEVVQAPDRWHVQRRDAGPNAGLVWQNRQLKRSLDAALARESELKKRYTIDGLQPWAEPVVPPSAVLDTPQSIPTTCPRCGSGCTHDVEGVLHGGTTFRQQGPTIARCMNEACGWRAQFWGPRS